MQHLLRYKTHPRNMRCCRWTCRSHATTWARSYMIGNRSRSALKCLLVDREIGIDYQRVHVYHITPVTRKGYNIPRTNFQANFFARHHGENAQRKKKRSRRAMCVSKDLDYLILLVDVAEAMLLFSPGPARYL